MNIVQKPQSHEVWKQLEQILKSEDFKRSARSSDFLKFILDKTLNDQQGQIKGYTIGIEVFGKPKDFDPDTDASVRVEASRLRRSMALYYHGPGKFDPVIIEIPKGGYVPVFSYNLNNKQARDVDTPTAADFKIAHWWKPHFKKIFISLMAMIFFLALSWTLFLSSRPSIDLVPVISVMPFYAVGDEDAQRISNDFRNLVISDLSRFKEIKVFSSPDVSNNKSGKWDTDYIIEATIKKNIDKVHMSVRLRDVHKRTYVWTYDRIISLSAGEDQTWQQDIAGIIASQLASPYAIIQSIEQDRLKNLDHSSFKTYQCIQDYYAYLNDKTAAENTHIKQCLEETVNGNPLSSNSWAYLSKIYTDEFVYDFDPTMNEKMAQKKTMEAASMALQIDPQNPRAHGYMADAALLNKDIDLARYHASMAVNLNPYDSDILAGAALVYARLGDWERGRPLAERAISSNRSYPRWYSAVLFTYYYQAGDYDDAHVRAREYYSPTNMFSCLALAISYAGLYRYDEAQKISEEIKKNFPKFAKDPKTTVSRWGFREEFVNKLLIGAKAAGLQFSELPSSVNSKDLAH